ncbi:helix-turn-helix domain-containing protein [Maribacter polysaccharolyticus]|uniref:helix-turn-helix domain-containing protein n=1 Tax=Maribacter polysaccharolyticus TaxID=3020831 RepID=UPI00237F0FEA|nr:helix-turn-helix domain-containing protein [Maribacter polysaccharolyticus]MDE3741781.1 helix-turn-helix domain-containing protein [Maribacter polysaccharolyticus]
MKVRRIKTISEFHRVRGLTPPLHPLVSLVDYGEAKILPEYIGEHWIFDFYSVGIKRNVGTLRYGQQEYDFDGGILSFIAPGQRLSIVPNHRARMKPSGWLLLLHPDFFWKTSLAKSIREHDFFGYAINEALFMSEKEEATLEGILLQIQREIATNMDAFSQDIIIAHIELLLQYANRYYQRQFITRKKENHTVLTKVEALLDAYFNEEQTIDTGLPTVQYLADKLHFSPSYLSSLLKSLTGLNAQQHIHEKLIAKAKEKLANTELSVSEIAYGLGFGHPQSFSKLFKSKVNLSPLEFRTGCN